MELTNKQTCGDDLMDKATHLVTVTEIDIDMDQSPTGIMERRPETTCFICGSQEVSDSVQQNPNQVELATCICRLFTFDADTQAFQFSGQSYCHKCQEYFLALCKVYEEVDALNKKLSEARQLVQEQICHIFKSSSARIAQSGPATEGDEDRHFHERVQLQKHVLKKASLLKARSEEKTKPHIEHDGVQNTDTQPLVSIKVEPRHDLYVNESDNENFGYSSLQDLELNQPKVRLSRMVILESLIQHSQGTHFKSKRAPQVAKADVKFMKPKRKALSSELIYDGSSRQITHTTRTRRINQQQRYSEYIEFSEEDSNEMDTFQATDGGINATSVEAVDDDEDDDFIVGLDNELYDEYDSDTQIRRSKSSTSNSKKTNKSSSKLVSRQSQSRKYLPVTTNRETCIVPQLHSCTIGNCSKGYISAGGLRKHQRIVHSIGPQPRERPPPPKAKIVAEASPNLDPMGEVVYIRLFPCKACGKEFRDSYELKYHMERHKPDNEQKYICEVCGKGFYKASLLKRHNRKHVQKNPTGTGEEDDGKILCQLCGISTTNLKQHMRIHTGEKQHKCTHCDKAFNTAHSARAHIRIHTGEKPFECKTCGFRFRTQQSYQRHLKVHDPVKTYICDHCGKSFRFKYNLTEHLHVHTRELPYRCNVCGRRYPERHILDKHMNDDHTAEQIERKKKNQSQRARQRPPPTGQAGQSSPLPAPSTEVNSAQPANMALIPQYHHISVLPTRYY